MVNVFSNEISRDELKPGDHIYSWRSSFLYAHHGIYVGDDKVIHFTLDPENGQVFLVSSSFFASFSHSYTYSSIMCLRCSELQQNGRLKKGVIIFCLDCFLNGKKLYLFSYSVSGAFFLAKIRGGTCTMAKSDPSYEVIYRAVYLLKHGFGSYDLFKNNCEDFPMYCKTGLVPKPFENTGRSGQINSLKFTVVPFALAMFLNPLAAVATTVGTNAAYRYSSDMGVREDMVEMQVEEFVRVVSMLEGERGNEETR
ncbi:hypothetical protein LUZ60_002405 [Juncus effusus]|nr:hypothetical protein LUZ60_002405 [Juncus effusus]